MRWNVWDVMNRRPIWHDLSDQGKWDAMHNDQRKLDIVERIKVLRNDPSLSQRGLEWSIMDGCLIEASNEIERLRYMIQALQGCTDDPPEDSVPG